MDERHVRIEFDANGVVTSIKPAQTKEPEPEEQKRPEKEGREDRR
jgi:hypothetical protein